MGQVQATDAGIRNTTHMGSRVRPSYEVLGQGHVLSIRMSRIENGDSWVGPQAQNL